MPPMKVFGSGILLMIIAIPALLVYEFFFLATRELALEKPDISLLENNPKPEADSTNEKKLIDTYRFAIDGRYFDKYKPTEISLSMEIMDDVTRNFVGRITLGCDSLQRSVDLDLSLSNNYSLGANDSEETKFFIRSKLGETEVSARILNSSETRIISASDRFFHGISVRRSGVIDAMNSIYLGDHFDISTSKSAGFVRFVKYDQSNDGLIRDVIRNCRAALLLN